MKNTSLAARLRAWLNDIPVQDPLDRHIASLLQVVLIGLIVLIILATLILVTIPSFSFQEKINVLISDLFGVLVVGLPLILLRRGYFRGSALIIVVILFITPTLAITVIFDLLNSGGILFQFTLAILLAGLLLSRSALAITFGLSATVVGIAAFRGQNVAPQLAMSNLQTALNFILFNGLITLFLDRFGITLRLALKTALERESELKNEVDDRRRADAALVESEERYRNLIDSARDVIFTISADGRITSLNPAFEIFTGWSRAEWLGRAFDELVTERDRTRAHDQFERILHGEILQALRLRMHTRTGDVLVVEMNISPQFKDDHVIGLLGIARDMTREQHVEDALKASEKRFRALIENGWDAFTLADAQGTIIYASPSTQRVLGYTPEEFVGVNAFTLFHPDDMILASTKLTEVMQAPGNVITAQVRTRHKDGSWRWMEGVVTNLFAEPDVQALVTNYRDISERKQAEDALRASEDFRRLIVDTEPECVKLIAPDGSLMEMNRAGLAMIEAESLEQVKGKVLLEIVAPEYKDAFRGLQQRVLAGGTGILEFEIIGLKGTRRWLETHAVPLRSHGDQIKALLGITRDITERKQAEKKNQRQNQRLKVLREIDTAILAANSVESIVGAALDHILELIGCQRASMALFDWGTNEVLVFSVRAARDTSIQKGTRAPLDLFHDIIQTLAKNQPALINALTAMPDLPPQYQALIKDGLRSMCGLPLFSQSSLIGSFTMYSEMPSFFDEEKVNLGREVANQLALAITQSRLVDALEERVREREKLIAELTAKNAELESFTYTVSHDLKSPLVTMKGFLGYLEQDAATGNVERLKEDTRRIANAVDKMHGLLNDLLELSRIGRFVNPSVLVPFEEIAREALELVHGQIKAAGATVQLQPGLPAVYGDRQRLIEVLQNLLDNAAKYMGDQPEPRIEIGQRGEDAEHGGFIFYVKDNGVGVAPEYHERIFGLFNKLDARSEGTGIGLALVRRIIEFHGGRIWVESEEGRGATFYFTLPNASLLR